MAASSCTSDLTARRVTASSDFLSFSHERWPASVLASVIAATMSGLTDAAEVVVLGRSEPLRHIEAQRCGKGVGVNEAARNPHGLTLRRVPSTRCAAQNARSSSSVSRSWAMHQFHNCP